MRIVGVNYDVGTPRALTAGETREEPGDAELERDLGLVAGELGCGGVRISGSDPRRLERAAQVALRHGLAVWLSPALHGLDSAAALDVIVDVARSAERLRGVGPRVGVLTGCEVSLFMRGFIPGETFRDRIAIFRRPWRLVPFMVREGSPKRRLNAFLRQAAAAVREVTDVPVSYASGTWEPVEWDVFDAVAVDHYLGRGGPDRYEQSLRRLVTSSGRPVVVTELGSATYTGAAARGGMAWDVVEPTPDGGRVVRSGVRRDEEEQARAVVAQLDSCERAGVEEAYVFSLVMPAFRHVPGDPRLDLDVASYALLASSPEAAADGVPRVRPKAAFEALATWTARHPARA